MFKESHWPKAFTTPQTNSRASSRCRSAARSLRPKFRRACAAPRNHANNRRSISISTSRARPPRPDRRVRADRFRDQKAAADILRRTRISIAASAPCRRAPDRAGARACGARDAARNRCRRTRRRARPASSPRTNGASERPSSRCGSRVAACPVEKRRREIDRFGECREASAPARRAFARIDDDQRHAHDLLVKKVLLAEPMVAEIVAVIAGDDDDRVVGEPALSQDARRAARRDDRTAMISPM